MSYVVMVYASEMRTQLVLQIVVEIDSVQILKCEYVD